MTERKKGLYFDILYVYPYVYVVCMYVCIMYDVYIYIYIYILYIISIYIYIYIYIYILYLCGVCVYISICICVYIMHCFQWIGTKCGILSWEHEEGNLWNEKYFGFVPTVINSDFFKTQSLGLTLLIGILQEIKIIIIFFLFQTV